MGVALQQSRLSADEFPAWEAIQAERHEFAQGEVFAMAGGEDVNDTVALDIAFALRGHPRGTPCRGFAGDVRWRVEAADGFFHPDLMVTCRAADAAAGRT